MYVPSFFVVDRDILLSPLVFASVSVCLAVRSFNHVPLAGWLLLSLKITYTFIYINRGGDLLVMLGGQVGAEKFFLSAPQMAKFGGRVGF